MLAQTVPPFKLEVSDETPTAHAEMALFGEYCWDYESRCHSRLCSKLQRRPQQPCPPVHPEGVRHQHVH